MSDTKSPLPREVADAYVDDLIALDPITGTYLGVKESSQPAARLLARRSGGRRRAERGRRSRSSTRPSGSRARTATPSGAAHACCASGSRRSSPCTRPTRGCARSATCTRPPHSVREVFTVTPAETDEDWAAIAAAAARGAGRAGGLPRVPRRSAWSASCTRARARPRPFIGQLTEWVGHGRFGPRLVRGLRGRGPRGAARGAGRGRPHGDRRPSCELRDWMRDVYAPGRRGRAGHGGPRAVRALVALLQRHRPGPGRGVRVRLVRVPPAARRDEARRRRRSCPAPGPRGRRSRTSTSTAGTSRASTRSAPGCRA